MNSIITHICTIFGENTSDKDRMDGMYKPTVSAGPYYTKQLREI